jgi:hypothetical protein
MFKSPSSVICVDMSLFAGNVTFTNVLPQPSQWEAGSNTVTSLTAIFIALSIVILSTTFRLSSDDKIHKLKGFYLTNVSKFFSRRFDFFQENFKKTGVKMFRFNLIQVSFLQSCLISNLDLSYSIA